MDKTQLVKENNLLLKEIERLEDIKNELEDAIILFVDGSAGAVSHWKKQPHIHPLFQLAIKIREERNKGEQ